MSRNVPALPKAGGDRSKTDADPWARHHLVAALDYAREREYRGWDLYDGESSRVLRAMPMNNKWVNLVFQQTVRRSPVNIRPLLLVEQRRNFMGIALFAVANLRAYELTGQERFREDARELVDWLIENQSEGYHGFCGGHKHPLQRLSKRKYPNDPGIVGTTYAVKALLAAGEYIDPSYRDVALTAADFVFEDLEYSSHPAGARIKYNPVDNGDHYTLNANALGARLLMNLYDVAGEPRFREGARNILDYVAAQQTEEGGWMYRDPPESSHLSLDNFHNGFVIESLLRFQEISGTTRYAETLSDAVRFYRGLFTDDGAPWFDESNEYPRDVHSSAQGAVVFTMLGDREFARRLIEWAVRNLSNQKGAFYHEQHRHYTKRTTFMRWCQAWMAHGISRYLTSALE
ncbi:glycoside hydrolase family protein [Halorubrum depositum]|uniref:antibiotic ABC transporter permease n=1 Tax=Halorubrum depositum TaxID=2583992 RepID=UPI0011A86416|nr:antibiotic ABC transporter permease [Halorubrum depositum]